MLMPIPGKPTPGTPGTPGHPASAIPGEARADLHCHSKFSDRPSEWILRRIGAPECFVEPMDLYRTAKRNGMKFVTISDHNCIAGALEIAHLPDTFISNEVTTYFPEDGCKIHMLTTGITESQFDAIQDLRPNIYALQRYLRAENIVHSVAHPLFRVNDRLTPDHFEKLILMFERFEAINGTRDKRACMMANSILSNLTPEMIHAMANRHGIDPAGDEPWIKTFTGGSDDHSGLYIGAAHTVTPGATTVEQFLDHLRAKRHRQDGEHGTSVMLGHCFYHIAYAYYRDRFEKAGGTNVVGELFKKLLGEAEAAAPASPGFGGRLRGRIRSYVVNRKIKKLAPVEQMLITEFRKLYEQGQGSGALDDRTTFQTACRLAHTLGYAFGQEFVTKMRAGNMIESLQTVAALGPVALAIAPYLASFKTQHKDAAFLEQVAAHFGALDTRRPAKPDAKGKRRERKAWLTDTFHDTNGVAVTIKTLAEAARASNLPLDVVTCLSAKPDIDASVVNFQPVGEFNLPEYEHQALAFPPFLELIEHIENAGYTELIISTPGPVGLVGLAAAKLLGLPTVGIYHTDFPAYVRHLTQDTALEALTAKFMVWFYDQCDVIFVPSPSYRQLLIRQGFDAGKLMLLPRGVDLRRFNPSMRDANFYRRWNLGDAPKLLYVGRVSREKNLDLMFDAFERLRERGVDADLVIVGDGPYLADLKQRHGSNRRVTFTGYLGGEELAAAYASADLFVFPSTTDTFGNVVLEAQASGLPAVVSNHGGPADLIRRHESGIICDIANSESMPDAIAKVLADRDLSHTLTDRALANAAQSSWPRVLDQLLHHRPPRKAPAMEPQVHLPTAAHFELA